MNRIAIVTGASSGLGSDFARQLAERRGLDELWLVARREDRLAALAAELKGKAVPRIVPIPVDLTKEGAAELRRRLEEEKPELDLLVLNAGAGRFASFEDTAKEDSLAMIDLNVRALTENAKDALPHFGRSGGMILVASLAGLGPMGNIAVYSATKAYVLAFGVALAVELQAKGIGVTVLCPGPVRTEFDAVAKRGDLGGSRETLGVGGSRGGGERNRGPVPSQLVVRRALRAYDRGRPYAFGHWSWALAPFGLRLVSRRFIARAAMRIMR